MAWTRWLAIAAAALLVGGAVAFILILPVATERRTPAIAIDLPAAKKLSRFESDQALADFLRAEGRLAREKAAGEVDAYAVAPQMASPAPMPRATPGGSRGTITNTQKVGVDEGDIVKQVGRFLIVLQDGRLFSVDTRPGGAAELRFADRANVYRTQRGHTWYDEMLVFGQRIVVTGYSYEQSASEVAVFALGRTGAITHESTFYLSSNDYYSTSNYATRLVNDKLILSSPYYLWSLDPDRPMNWPRVRRWREGADGAVSEGTRLFQARDIYGPLLDEAFPAVHVVSVCPLGGLGPGDELACKSTGLMGASQREFYVSRVHAYLWLTQNPYEHGRPEEKSCGPGVPRWDDVARGVLYQIPLDGAAGPRAIMVRGSPPNQFSLDSSDQEFRALLMWDSTRCWADGDRASLKYFHTPLDSFSIDAREAPRMRYVDVPPSPSRHFENRFTDRYLVYGGGLHGRYEDLEYRKVPGARIAALSLDDPSRSAILDTSHSVIRIERAGDNVVLTGYRDPRGLSLSLLDLRRGPRIAHTAFLEGRHESEGRSHAFNSLVDADGGGLIGIPTLEARGARWPWRSEASDVSFLSLDRTGRLSSIGELRMRANSIHPDYRCEVSCIDWYGNSRPIFTDGRVFALSGTELVEGAIVNGRIAEIRRLNLTAPLKPRGAALH